MKPKKLFIFPQLGFSTIVLSAVMIASYVPVVIYMDSLLAIIMSGIIFVALPVIMLIIASASLLAQISIDKDGVTQYIFGKKTKFFPWNEICEIKGLSNPFCLRNYPFDWIVLCTKPISDNEVDCYRNRKFIILIFSRKPVLYEIIKHKPNNLY